METDPVVYFRHVLVVESYLVFIKSLVFNRPLSSVSIVNAMLGWNACNN